MLSTARALVHRRVTAVLLGAAAVPLFASGAQAATLTVTTTADSTSGSLRAQVAAANPGDTVFLPASAQHYQVTAGEIPITKAITIQGAGPTSSVIDASHGSSRVFHMTTAPASGTLTFEGVTVTGGRAMSLPGGGGILIDHISSSVSVNLALVNAAFTGNTVTVSTGNTTGAAGGGGVYSDSGGVSLTNSSVSANTVTVIGSSVPNISACCDGGGGIYDNSGTGGNVTLSGSVVNGNQATVSGQSGIHGGGGIYSDGSNVTVARSQVSNNSFTLNGTSTDTTGDDCCNGGGAIYQDGAVAPGAGLTTISSSTLNGNTATVTSGDCCHGGGAVFDESRGGTISSSALSHNTATVNGSTQATDTHSESGGGALYGNSAWTITGSTLAGNTSQVTATSCCHGGGAIHFNATPPLTVVATTISNNRSLISGGTTSGGGGVYERIHGFAAGSFTNSTISGNTTNAGGTIEMGGGGLYLNNYAGYTATLANVTLAGNSAPQGRGGGVYNYGSELDAKDSIVALNSALSGGNCANGGVGPVFTSLGYNLTDSPDTCSFTAAGDKVLAASSIGLGPLANNGGPTLTRALLPGSPAVNAGNPAGCTNPAGALLSTDQRGFKRPSGGRCDIGAFELQLNAARCTLKAKSRVVLLHPRRKKRRLRNRLQLKVTCNQSATVKLIGTLTRRRHKHRKRYKLSAAKTVSAGKTITILLRLPKAALSSKYKDSIKLRLTATNANGVGTATLTIGRLRVRRR